MRNGIALLAAFALGVVLLAAAMLSLNRREPIEVEPVYQFEVLDRGNVYVVDYGLSKENCAKLKGGYCREVRHGRPGGS